MKMVDISVCSHAKASKRSRKEKIGDAAERGDVKGKRRELVYLWKIWPYMEASIRKSSFVNIPHGPIK